MKGRMKGRKSSREGQAPAEKAGRLIDPLASARHAREAEEEARWAALAGPVTVRRKGVEPAEDSVAEPLPDSLGDTGASATYKAT